MDRTDLLNYFVEQRDYKAYLEITIHDKQDNFARIKCNCKTTTYPYQSDDFFTCNKLKADIIFIDGILTEEQVAKDLNYARQSLSENGMIILHDCMPPDEWHQRTELEVNKGENWNGAVWKVALREFNSTTNKCTLLDSDWGCGIIDTSIPQVPRCISLPINLEYHLHYPLLLQYKKYIADFLRDRVQVFYHLACMGNWKEVLPEQIIELYKNGFKQVNLTLLGLEEDLHFTNSLFLKNGVEATFLFHTNDLQQFERPALIAIEEYAKRNEGYVLYLHSKGVSNPADINKIKWRRLMMRELVEQWETCVIQLPYYDTIGVNWRDMTPTSHFCGNFWYASTKYLRKLANFRSYYDHPRYQIWDAIESKRLGCEFWISSGNDRPKVLSLFCRNVDFCNPLYWNDKQF